MDLFTQHYTQYQQAEHDVQVDLANQIGPHLSAARARRLTWQRLHGWMRSVAREADSGANKKATDRRPIAGEPPVKQSVAPT